MAGSKRPGCLGLNGELLDQLDGTLTLSESYCPGPSSLNEEPSDPDIDALLGLAPDLLHMALDLAGIVDPTPISDGASAVLSLARGLWLDAVISGASMVPYIGDLAKAGKLPRYLKSLEKAVEIARRSNRAAQELMPGMVKLKQAIELIPAGVNAYIDRMRILVDGFIDSRRLAKAAELLPDISHRFKFKSFEQNEKIYKEAAGRLGIPGKVKTHRSNTAQRGVSSGTGDDAGHLIGNRFGASGGPENLTPQNWIANRGGTYKALEDKWADNLSKGIGIDVKVSDVVRKGEDRPFMRKVEWTEIASDGTQATHELTFANTHTPKSREARDIAPTVSTPQTDNVIHVDFKNGRRKDEP